MLINRQEPHAAGLEQLVGYSFAKREQGPPQQSKYQR